MTTLEKLATHVIQTLQSAGHSAYFVGGAVRDRLLNLEVSDIDIATSASVDEVSVLFDKTIPVGVKFGIIIVVVDHHHHFEVASFRQDIDYIDGRHPSGVTKATIEQDAKRRDFTINGLYYDPLTFQIFDFCHGQDDLKKRVIRAIGDPKERFKEDHLRMIRACRYAATLGFEIEQKTSGAIIEMSSFVKEGLSIERIHQELDKMHSKGVLGKGLGCLLQHNLIKSLFPQLSDQPDLLLMEKIAKIKKLSSHVPLVLALLILFDVDSSEKARELVNYFKMSNQALKIALSAVTWLDHDNLNPLELAKLLSEPYSDSCIEKQACQEHSPNYFLSQLEMKKKHLKPVMTLLEKKQLIVSAAQVLELGIPKGPKVKELLDDAMLIFAQNPHLTSLEILELLKKKINFEA